MFQRHIFAASLLACVLFPVAGAQSKGSDLKDHYIKHEYLIPMRDGVKLFTSVYTPKDSLRTHPILLVRTPYSCYPYGEDKYAVYYNAQGTYYAERKYILVTQDVRGRFMSEGEFEDVRPYVEKKSSPKDIDETSDTYDTVDWLVKNIAGNNGNVGIHGISYPGFYAWMGTIDAHPAMKATSPQAPVSQWFGGDDWYHNGAFMLSHAFSFYANFGWPRTEPTTTYPQHFRWPYRDGYRFFLELGALSNANARFFHDSVAYWNTLNTHGHWDDFWQQRTILPHLKNLKPPVLVVGGWFDAENLYGALRSYEAAEKQNPNNNIRLVMGPWAHGWWNARDLDSLGYIKFGSVTTSWFTEQVIGPFFDHYLDGAPEPKLAEATVFMTGENAWKLLDAWPPRKAINKRLYFREHEGLSWEATSEKKDVYDEYVNDPANPVPYTNELRQWYNAAYMLEDQRFADRRPDVLVYQTPVLQEDVTIAGPINVHLTASTSGTDCDWIVKVIDVLPDTAQTPRSASSRGISLEGYEMMVRGDVLRGKFRNSLSKPVAFSPHQPTNVNFVLQDVFHRFKKGHRIMVQVQSSWFPKIDRNPGKFMDIYGAKDSDFQKTTQRVYRSAGKASSIEVGVLTE